MAKTMRNIWDEERKIAQKQKEPAVFSRTRVTVGGQAEEGPARQNFAKQNLGGQAKTKKYFLEHLELRKAVMDFFPDYQKYLGEGGFTKA